MKIKLTESEFKSLIQETIKKVLNENGPFNDGGEPTMTHQQYRDYSEPSEPDYDNFGDNENFNIKSQFAKELKYNDILLETFDGEGYFIRCKPDMDFQIQFIDDETIKIYIYTEQVNEEKMLSFDEALKFILKNKNIFYSFDESVRESESDYSDELQDRKNNAMERGSW